jgi:hypothetical protein
MPMRLTPTLTVRTTETAYGPQRLSLFRHSTILLHPRLRKTRVPASCLRSAVSLRRWCAIGLSTRPSQTMLPVPGSIVLKPCIGRRLSSARLGGDRLRALQAMEVASH